MNSNISSNLITRGIRQTGLPISIEECNIKVCLISPSRLNQKSKWVRGTLDGLLASYNLFDSGYEIVEDASLADLIIFTDSGHLPHGLTILLHPIFRKFKYKCFVYDENDFANNWYRGINVSGCKSQSSSKLTCGGAYVREILLGSGPLPFPEKEVRLFSFVGAAESHPVRGKLRDLYTDDGSFFDVPRSVTQTAFQTGCPTKIKELVNNMENVCYSSLFVLCPRGVGASSMRLFEVMRMGRCPVIISDEWIEPYGPDWASCSIRIPENQLNKIPYILNLKRPLAQVMGKKARIEWEYWFAPNRHFQTTVKACLFLHEIPNSKAFSISRLLYTLFSINGLRIFLRYLRNYLLSISKSTRQ